MKLLYLGKFFCFYKFFYIWCVVLEICKFDYKSLKRVEDGGGWGSQDFMIFISMSVWLVEFVEFVLYVYEFCFGCGL